MVSSDSEGLVVTRESQRIWRKLQEPKILNELEKSPVSYIISAIPVTNNEQKIDGETYKIRRSKIEN